MPFNDLMVIGEIHVSVFLKIKSIPIREDVLGTSVVLVINRTPKSSMT